MTVATDPRKTGIAVPFGPAPRIKFFGHSYMEGKSGPSKQTNRFSTLICALLGAHEENYGWHGGSTRYTQIGSSPWLNSVPPRVSPFGAACNAALIYTGINEVSATDPDPDITVAWLRCMTHWLRAQQRMTVQDAAYVAIAQGTGAANWLQNALTYGPSGDQWKGVTGNVITITTPSTFPGGSLRLWYGTQLNVGGVHTLTANGAAAGTVDTRGATQSTVKPAKVEITGLPAGVNTITDTLSSVSSGGEQFMYAEYAATNPPPVLVANVNKCPSYAANGGVATDAAVDDMNARIAAMMTEFADGRAVVLDVDAALGKNSAYFAGDGLHLNDDGNRVVAVAAAKTFRALLRDDDSFASAKAASPESLHRLRVDQGARGTNGVSQAPSGIATLVAGTVTVSTRALESASDLILLTRQSGASTGTLSITAKTVGSGATTSTFVITSSDGADVGTVAWLIVNSVL